MDTSFPKGIFMYKYMVRICWRVNQNQSYASYINLLDEYFLNINVGLEALIVHIKLL